MADGGTADLIRAAGALLWRPAGGGTQVALVHRPKYDDWGFAKGKLEPGEHILLAAVREVAEETGLRVTLGRNLPAVGYPVEGQPKRVDYWSAQVTAGAGTFTPSTEVDVLEWVAARHAAGRLSYAHDVQLLADFLAGPRRTTPLILVRHASAGSKSSWRKADQDRPLSSRGKHQAKMLARLFACFGVSRVISSPAERCLATVRPFAAFTGAEIEVQPAFAVEASGKKSARHKMPEELARAAASAVAGVAADPRPAVICAHRENIPLLLASVCEQLGAEVPGGPPLRKGGLWVLHRGAGQPGQSGEPRQSGQPGQSGQSGQLAGAERHHPDDWR